MRKNRSKFASKKYEHLYRYPEKTSWVYRRYSSQKRGEFYFVTGEEKNEALAHKIGTEAFEKWLGSFTPTGRKLLIKDLARAVLASKEGGKGGTKGNSYRSAKNQIQNHIIPAFGHLRPEQVTATAWTDYIAAERKAGRDRKFFNMRKFLREILNRAADQGLIRQAPKLANPDPKAKPPVHHDKATVLRILRHGSRTIKLLGFIMWKQGARPGEVLQYRWEMIRWNAGSHGEIAIPGHITKTNRPRTIPLDRKVARILRWLDARRESPWLFPAQDDPSERVTVYQKSWERACLKADVRADIYELRDTFITNALRRGKSSTFIAKYVDSSTTMIDGRYAVAVRAAMEDLLE